ncbi:MAG: hypothetical protein U0470_00985 [Anaerolineae bacterium]
MRDPENANCAQRRVQSSTCARRAADSASSRPRPDIVREVSSPRHAQRPGRDDPPRGVGSASSTAFVVIRRAEAGRSSGWNGLERYSFAQRRLPPAERARLLPAPAVTAVASPRLEALILGDERPAFRVLPAAIDDAWPGDGGGTDDGAAPPRTTRTSSRQTCVVAVPSRTATRHRRPALYRFFEFTLDRL